MRDKIEDFIKYMNGRGFYVMALNFERQTESMTDENEILELIGNCMSGMG